MNTSLLSPVLKCKGTFEVCTEHHRAACWAKTQGRNSVVFGSKKGSGCVSSCNCLAQTSGYVNQHPNYQTTACKTKIKLAAGLLLIYQLTANQHPDTCDCPELPPPYPYPPWPPHPTPPDRISGSTSCAVECNGSGWSPCVPPSECY